MGVVSIAVPAAVCEKVLNNAPKAKARDAQLFGVSPACADAELFDTLLPVPMVIPIQLIEFSVAAHCGLESITLTTWLRASQWSQLLGCRQVFCLFPSVLLALNDCSGDRRCRVYWLSPQPPATGEGKAGGGF
jgi:hypothetical protein